MQKTDRSGNEKAWTAALLRSAVAAYLVYLGYRIIVNPDTEMSGSTARILGGIMIAAAAAFAVYIVLRLKSDLHADQTDKTSEQKGVTE